MGHCRYEPVVPAILAINEETLHVQRAPMSQAGLPQTFPRRAWAADLVGLAVLAEFAGERWQATIDVEPPPAANSKETAAEIELLGELMRSARAKSAAEIAFQDTDMQEYIMRTLMISPVSHPATFEALKCATRVGEFLMCHYKMRFARPRPQQLAPGLMPGQSLSSHPAYPSGHATISHLIAYALADIVPDALAASLHALADRISRNREIAGFHYASDSAAGKSIAMQAQPILGGCKLHKEIKERAVAEWL